MTEPVAILKTTQNPAAARAFVDFILSDEGQKLAVAMGYIPAQGQRRHAVVVSGRREDQPDADRHFGKVVQANNANLKRFAELFGN